MGFVLSSIVNPVECCREAASQHYQNQIFPPSLVHAAANNKSAQLHQQAALLNTSILSPPVTPWKLNNHEANVSRYRYGTVTYLFIKLTIPYD